MIRSAIFLWLALSAAVLTLYFWQGWHMRPAPTHWWWYSFGGLLSGVSIGQQLEQWSQRRAARRLERAVQALRDRAQMGGET